MSNPAPISVALSEVAEGKMHALSRDGRELVICRTKEGVYALDNICTHAYARLNEGRLRGTRLICPLHGAAFDVRDGRVLGAPATRPLATHAVNVVDDRIEITVAPSQPNSLAL
ncbi:MAG: non-heme iron oxygenase ferredoxin subunit [Gammaproteobacteria bacterium]